VGWVASTARYPHSRAATVIPFDEERAAQHDRASPVAAMGYR
jgi:hypothetical protein